MESDNAKLYYAALWRRFLGFVIDGVIFMPILHGFSKAMGNSPRLYAALFLPLAALNVGYWVVCHAVWGKTIGKHCMGIRVTGVDGSCITWREAFLRQSVYILLAVVSGFALIPAYLEVPVEGYAEMTKPEQAALLRSVWPDWYPLVFKLQQAWMVCTCVAMLFNKRGRALHDFIAGTIVVQKKPTRRQLKNEDPYEMDCSKEMKRLNKLQES